MKHQENGMSELSTEELSIVAGGSFFNDLGRWIGFVWGRGARTQQRIDAMENPMLGAMQYGA